MKKSATTIYGYSTYSKDSNLTMKYAKHCHEKRLSDWDRWVCPKVHIVNGEWVCDCPQPCNTAKKERTTHTYDNMDFRTLPSVQRDSAEWNSLYKIRTIAEHTINHVKINMCTAGPRSRDHAVTKEDVFLAGIASQLTIIVAHQMSCPQYIRSLKSLIA